MAIAKRKKQMGDNVNIVEILLNPKIKEEWI